MKLFLIIQTSSVSLLHGDDIQDVDTRRDQVFIINK